MKLNFEEMSTRELRAYVLEHREDIEPLRILMNRRTSNSKVISFPIPNTEEEWQQQLEAIAPILEQDREKERDKKINKDS